MTFTRRQTVSLTAATAGLVLTAVAAVAAVRGPSTPEPPSGPLVTRAAQASPPGGSVEDAITRAQAHLKQYPKDASTWAALGSAYVQQARIGGDSSYYPKAEGALRRSLTLRPGNAGALAGMGALDNARHDFTAALGWARKAQAVDPYDATAFGVEDDALTQLGDYPGARRAAQRMLDLEPGVPSFTRAAYHFEQTGDVDAARQALGRALEVATQPSDIAFCRYHLGQLAVDNGDPETALEQYRLGLEADPEGVQLLAGQARARAATGDLPGARADYATVVARLPQAQYLLEYTELLLAMHHDDEAERQLDLIAVEERLQAASGVVDGLTAATVAADHGSAADAVTLARAEWSRRKSVLVADALAWALHRAGKDDEARDYAIRAGRLGWRNATFSYHRGMIELALGNDSAAREHLERALAVNPSFSLIEVDAAKAALASLKDSP